MNETKEKIVYVGFCADPLHHGHINIIKIAKKLGKVIVGLMTDEAMASYKRVPVMKYKDRKTVVENIKGVSEVIPSETWDYVPNLRKLKPDYLVHGDEWQGEKDIQHRTRQRAIEVLKEWGGELIEPPYTKGISSTSLVNTYWRD